MGKIVAIGGINPADIESKPIVDYIVSLSERRNPKVLFLPTASFDIEDDVDLFEKVFNGYGCSFETLYLTDESLTDSDIESKILGADIVYVGGGNLKFLMDTWEKTNADKYFKKAYENGTILSGSSSGAMCWFDMGYDDCGENHEYIFVDCIGLLPYCNCPHFESESWQSFAEAIKTQDISGIAIDGCAAVSFIDGEYKVIRALEDRNAYFFAKDSGFHKTKM